VEALAQVRPWLGGGEGGGLVCKTHGLTGVTRPQSVMCVLGGGAVRALAQVGGGVCGRGTESRASGGGGVLAAEALARVWGRTAWD
jgi:hypothetical protein